jgi:hypothetical protein
VPEHPDFRYLCDCAEKAGWTVGLGMGGVAERDADNNVHRRHLGSITLVQKSESSRTVIRVPIPAPQRAEQIAEASRAALAKLMGRGEKAA